MLASCTSCSLHSSVGDMCWTVRTHASNLVAMQAMSSCSCVQVPMQPLTDSPLCLPLPQHLPQPAAVAARLQTAAETDREFLDRGAAGVRVLRARLQGAPLQVCCIPTPCQMTLGPTRHSQQLWQRTCGLQQKATGSSWTGGCGRSCPMCAPTESTTAGVAHNQALP